MYNICIYNVDMYIKYMCIYNVYILMYIYNVYILHDVYMYINTCTHIMYLNIDTFIYTYTAIHMNICIHIYTYVYKYIHTSCIWMHKEGYHSTAHMFVYLCF